MWRLSTSRALFSSFDSLILMWPDDSPFLRPRPASDHVPLVSIILLPMCIRVLYFYTKSEFLKFTTPKFWENYFFSQNAQVLRHWKSSLTQKWIHSTIFEKLIVMYFQNVVTPVLAVTWTGNAPESCRSAFPWLTLKSLFPAYPTAHVFTCFDSFSH